MSALATVARKSFNGKFTTKIDFPNGPEWAFHVTIVDADIGNLKSLHTLFDKYFDKKQKTKNKNKNKQKKPPFLKTFWHSIDAIFEDVSVAETIFWC